MTIIPFPSADDDAADFYPCDVDPFPAPPAHVPESFTHPHPGSLAWILLIYLVGGSLGFLWWILHLLGAF
jgi:hypothetical protein